MKTNPFLFTIPEAAGRRWLAGEITDGKLLGAGRGGALFVGYVQTPGALLKALRVILRHGGPVFYVRGRPEAWPDWWATESAGRRCLVDHETVKRLKVFYPRLARRLG